MNYKKLLDTYLSNRYDYLYKCAINILKNTTSNLEAGDLISELTIHLYTNEEKIQRYIAMDKLEGFCVTYMNLNGKYASSSLNKKYKVQFDELDNVLANKLGEETTYSNEDEYVQELEQHYTSEQITKILAVDAILNQLTLPEKILFDAYFVKNLSYDKICEQYTFFREKDGKKVTYKSKKSIYNMMTELKNKILYLIDYDAINN